MMPEPNQKPAGVLRPEVLRAIIGRLLAGGVTPKELIEALWEVLDAA